MLDERIKIVRKITNKGVKNEQENSYDRATFGLFCNLFTINELCGCDRKVDLDYPE